MVDLADVGRSRAGSDLANFIIGERQRKITNAQAQERTDAYAAHTNSMADINENRLIKMREERAAGEKKIAVQPLIDRFPVPAVGQYAMNLARAYDYINPDGTIQVKHAKEIHAALQQPMHMPQISNLRVEHAQKEYDTLLRASKDPETAKKLKLKPEEVAQQLDAATLKLHAAKGANAELMTSIKARSDYMAKEAALIKAQRGTDARAVKAYIPPGGTVDDVVYLPNNEIPPAGYKPYKEAGSTKDERYDADLRARLPGFRELAARDPNLAYAKRIRINDDGTVYENAKGLPELLPNFTKEIGKRGGPKAAKAAGEAWDDTQELSALLLDPEVAAELGAISQEFGEIAGSSIWDNTKGAFKNTVKAWMTKHKISGNSKTVTALRRIQRMASETRKTFLGSAVTGTELQSTLGWMPNPGDSYEDMVNKNNLGMHEAKEIFLNWLNLYKNVADMTPWYKTFGIQRFNASDAGTQGLSPEAQNYLKGISQ